MKVFSHRLAAAVILVVLSAEHQGLWSEPLGKWLGLVAGVVGTLFVQVRGGESTDTGKDSS